MQLYSVGFLHDNTHVVNESPETIARLLAYMEK